jgi:hypothetical protein
MACPHDNAGTGGYPLGDPVSPKGPEVISLGAAGGDQVAWTALTRAVVSLVQPEPPDDARHWKPA